MELCIVVMVLLRLSIGWPLTMAQSQNQPYHSLGATLSSNQTWLSENGTFTMGFQPIPANSNSLYLGVWYSEVPVELVWLLNREIAVKNGATLTLNNDGNLVLSDADGSQIWDSNTTSSGVVRASFLENGNLVLQKGSGATVWDSFNYPTDTFLPGLVVQVGQKFISWKSNSDPSAGLYSFELMDDGELYFKWNETNVYYKSGPWEGSHFTNPPQLGRTTPPDTFYYDNSTGSPRFWYTTSGRSASADVSLKRFKLDPDGVARQHIWYIQGNAWLTFISAPVEPCDSYRVCGQNTICTSSNYIPDCSCLPDFEPVSAEQWSSQDYWLQGCRRSPVLECTNESTSNSFMTLTNYIIENESYPQIFFNDTEGACRERCVQNCSCSGYSFLVSQDFTNCTLHSTSTVLYNSRYSNSSARSTPFSLRFQANPSALGHKRATFSGAKLIVTLVLVSFVVVLGVASASWWLLTKRRAKHRTFKDFNAVGLLRFTYKELVDATGNFNRQLGSGGFGSVCKGVLEDNSEVAVKTLEKLRQGEQEFRTEVAVIGTIQHINLVRLRGFCAEGSHRALVYELIPNGSLERYLFRKGDNDQSMNVLDWRMRMNIALGAARGIAYLHHECRSNIIHCDIKPENILIGSDFTPKVSDFGLAKLMGKDVSKVITNIRGTRGYLAPEWLTNSILTTKVDVYSYGMTLLELIGGRRTVDLSYPTEKWFYAVWAFKQMSRGEQLSSLIDEKIAKDSVDEGELRRALQVGLWCTQDDPEKRPSMRDVVKMLEGTLNVKNAPAPPSYAQTAGDNTGGEDGQLKGNQDGSQMDRISFEYTQTFSGR